MFLVPQLKSNPIKAQTLVAGESLGVSRHDQHNLEVKCTLATSDQRERVAVDLFLFLPGHLNLANVPRTELREDFRLRMRLGTQQTVNRQASRVRDLLSQVQHAVETFAGHSSSQTLEEIFQKTRELGAILGEMLKFENRHLRSELLTALSRSHMAPNRQKILAEIVTSLHQIDQLVSRTENLCTSKEAKSIPVIELLHQYIQSLYSDFLIKLGEDQTSLAGPAESEQVDTWRELGNLIQELRMKVAKSLISDGAQDTELSQEVRLLRQSQIKKFFQSQMFMEVERTETLKRFSEPAAAGAAAFAAAWAAAFEFMSQPGSHNIGLPGAVVICMGVALYVLKDRLKDKFRSVFTDKLAAVLPEAEQVLSANGHKIGKVSERFTKCKTSALSADVQSVRRRGDLCEAEKHLTEEVLHFGQEFELEPCITSYGDFQRTIQEVLRVNIERFLKHLDDAYKTIGLLDSNGDLKRIKSHRVYHFHVALQMKRSKARSWWQRLVRSPKTTLGAVDQIYRVVVDKNGIDRVEAL